MRWRLCLPFSLLLHFSFCISLLPCKRIAPRFQSKTIIKQAVPWLNPGSEGLTAPAPQAPRSPICSRFNCISLLDTPVEETRPFIILVCAAHMADESLRSRGQRGSTSGGTLTVEALPRQQVGDDVVFRPRPSALLFPPPPAVPPSSSLRRGTSSDPSLPFLCGGGSRDVPGPPSW